MRTISETPRTDSNSNSIIGFWTCATVPTSFARELERENTKLREIIKLMSLQILELKEVKK